jgi:hypothetical protein
VRGPIRKTLGLRTGRDFAAINNEKKNSNMIIPIIVAYITACLLGMYFLYQHWLNTPPDTWPERRGTSHRNSRGTH